jgi:large subunit ribosomal protein L5
MFNTRERYTKTVKQQLQERFKYSNPMLVPEINKIVISMGIAEAAKDKNAIQDCIKEITLITGQKPIVTRSKKAIANFKLREDQPVGLKVTLRRKRMYDFLDRFIHIVSPRIRDFRGFSLKCDGYGNYSIGLTDQQVFPELNLDDVKRTQGMNLNFVTSAQTDEECIELLQLMGFPFSKPDIT